MFLLFASIDLAQDLSSVVGMHLALLGQEAGSALLRPESSALRQTGVCTALHMIRGRTQGLPTGCGMSSDLVSVMRKTWASSIVLCSDLFWSDQIIAQHCRLIAVTDCTQ